MTPYQNDTGDGLATSDHSLKMMNFMMLFFSEIAISATHDMKNYLAIINENVGLLEELFQRDLARTLAQNRDKSVTQTIKNQIGRTDQVLKKLNRFAHNLASQEAVTDVESALGLVLDLCAGIIRNHGTTIEVVPAQTKVYTDAPPFLVSLMLFRAVHAGLDAADGEKKINISFSPAPSGFYLEFTLDRMGPGSMTALLSAQEEIELMQFLNITIIKDMENGFALHWTAHPFSAKNGN